MNTCRSNAAGRIRKLEEFPGAPLFQRLHRGIAPTANGDRLYRYAKNAIASADSVVRAMRDDRAAPDS